MTREWHESVNVWGAASSRTKNTRQVTKVPYVPNTVPDEPCNCGSSRLRRPTSAIVIPAISIHPALLFPSNFSPSHFFLLQVLVFFSYGSQVYPEKQRMLSGVGRATLLPRSRYTCQDILTGRPVELRDRIRYLKHNETRTYRKHKWHTRSSRHTRTVARAKKKKKKRKRKNWKRVPAERNILSYSNASRKH